LKGILAQAKDKASDGVNPKWRVRLMTEADVDEVLRIQRLCYEPEYRELPESYVGRIRLYPQGNVIVEVPVFAASADNGDDTSDSSSDDEGDSSDSENDNDNDACNDCDEYDDNDDEDSDNDHVAPVKQVKNQVTKYSPSGSPTCEEDARDLHSVKKRRVGKASAPTTRWSMAGYIQAQPYLREGINDVNDLTDLERWLDDHPTMDKDQFDLERDVIYVHEIAMDPAFRGQGLTTPLTDYVNQLTADEGFAMITLVSLGPALGFWQRNGFVLCRELDYGGHICYYMEKLLPAASSDSSKPLADR
jgi:ribosomal protein S18 acetylase RimI-like enzyme